MEKFSRLKETESRYSDTCIKSNLTLFNSGGEVIRLPYSERVMKDFYFVMQNGYFSIEREEIPDPEVSLYCTTPLSTQDLIIITNTLGGNDCSVSEEDSLYLSDIISDLRSLLSSNKTTKA